MVEVLDQYRLVIDFIVILASAAAAWYWYSASRRTVRRMTRDEALDAADLNRIVTAINRNQLLNSRAALASAIAAFFAIMRLLADLR